jgi:hypothetical protein
VPQAPYAATAARVRTAPASACQISPPHA